MLPERHVEVHYVDYGNYEKLPISSLREPAKAISHVNSLPFQVCIPSMPEMVTFDTRQFFVVKFIMVELQHANHASKAPNIRKIANPSS